MYCHSLSGYSRRKTIEVKIGDIALGGQNPIRVQSMTTYDTMDTRASVDQIRRMVESGCEYVRLTAPSIKEAKNLKEIKNLMNEEGIFVPLIADIHFTPNAAEVAAQIVEKVRVNPGNYADKKKFQTLDYTDAEYQAELERIREKFVPLIKVCKEYGTAMRIGTNHGSLSDRIMSRYGDTPMGMVESAMEFLRICESENYHDIVLSMKASNPQVMIQAYRLLVEKMQEEGLKPYPLHLGVTEAGEGEDGRIKSALGIGALLEDGLGDTVRVSLTEDPEFEAPVAKILVDRYKNRANHSPVPAVEYEQYSPFQYEPRETREVYNFGAGNFPRVIADFSEVDVTVKSLKSVGHYFLPEPEKWVMNDQGADYIYTGSTPINFMLPNGMKQIVDYNVWQALEDRKNNFPLIQMEEYSEHGEKSDVLNFLQIDICGQTLQNLPKFESNTVLLLHSSNEHRYADLRRFMLELKRESVDVPVVFFQKYDTEPEVAQIYASTDLGPLFTDGFGNGIMISGIGQSEANSLAFGILQASRTRISKTEYISCPSCGRTLFDLQETTAMIRKQTDHLKGLKIGIMGCIVNGPGEMADADYGYVGSGVGKITLYRGQEVVKRAVPSKEAVRELINIIKEDGNWLEPESVDY